MRPDGTGCVGGGGGHRGVLRRGRQGDACAGHGRNGEQWRRRAGGGQAFVREGLPGGGMDGRGQGAGFRAVEAADGDSGELSRGIQSAATAAGVWGFGGCLVRRGAVQSGGRLIRGGHRGVPGPFGLAALHRHAQRHRHGHGRSPGLRRGGGSDGDLWLLQERAGAVSGMRICRGSEDRGHRHLREELLREKARDVCL